MGVGGLLIWLKEAFPEAFTQPETGRSHLLIDANSQVHDAIRNARGACETEVIRRFVSSVDQLVQQYQPSRGLSVALDGPAPLAKLETQRQRRLKKKSSGARTAGVSGNAVTPGTCFMALIDDALMEWAGARTCNGLPCSVLIDPTVRAGEGEVKIFEHLMHHWRPGAVAAMQDQGEPSASCTIIGSDSDLLLLCLMQPPSLRVQVVVEDKGRAPVAFCLDRFRQRLGLGVGVGVGVACTTRDGCGGFDDEAAAAAAAASRAVLDSFVLLCLFCGDDYLRALPQYSLRLAFATWELQGRPTLVHRAPIRYVVSSK